MTIEDRVHGYYSVDGETFSNKLSAVFTASAKKTSCQYHYYDSVYSTVKPPDDRVLEAIDLDSLYKERAMQLRDKYDYLVLYYSGGSDSLNILKTFLSNNIKLDCVYVLHPEAAANRNIYVPNQNDTSGYNQISEWDLTIKHDLESLRLSHPEIHIEIGDWANSVESFADDFEKQLADFADPQLHMARFLKKHCPCKFEDEKLAQRKTVGTIYGVDKPNIQEKDGGCYFYFADVSSSGRVNPKNPSGVEYFYWSPEFPLLVMAQAYKTYKWYVAHPEFRYLIDGDNVIQKRPWNLVFGDQDLRQQCIKNAVYTTWDSSRFQVTSPKIDIYLPAGIRMWEAPLAKIPEYALAGSKWSYHWESFARTIDRRFLMSPSQLVPMMSKKHFLTAAAAK